MAKTFKTSRWDACKWLSSCMQCPTIGSNWGKCRGYGQGEKMCQLTGMAHDLSNKDT